MTPPGANAGPALGAAGSAAAAPHGSAKDAKPLPPRRDYASRWFGYDVFISFALGGPPRGSLSYASDLARRLRERDFTVFFSEDEAPPGEELDSTLRRALHSSRALVVIANHGTLQAPRWVRKEVESFRGLRPARPVIPISVGGALQDAQLAAATLEWLPFKDRIWLDETQQAGDAGIASADLVERLALAPGRVRANVKWRWLVRAVIAALVALAIGLVVYAKLARDNEALAIQNEKRAVASEQRARAELMRSVALRAAAEAPAMVSGERAGGHERALQQLLAAHALGTSPTEVGGAMLQTLTALSRELKVVDTGAVIRAMAFNPQPGAGRFVTGGTDGKVQQWNAETLQPVGPPLPGPTAEILTVAYSPDGQTIAAAGTTGRLWLWDASTGERKGAPPLQDADTIRSLAFITPHGRRIVTGSVGGALKLWDAATGQPLDPPLSEGGEEFVAGLAVSRDGQRIALGGDGYGRLLTSRGTGWNSTTLERPDSMTTVLGVAFSPDGSRIASANNDGSVRLWDGKTGKPVGVPLQGHPGDVRSVQFSADGERLLSGGVGGTLVLWNVKGQARIADWLKGQDGAVTGIAFSPDGQRAVSSGEDGLLRLWDASTPPPRGEARIGALASTLRCGARVEPLAMRPMRFLGFSPDCKLVVMGSQGSMRLVEASTGLPLGAAALGHRTREVRDANNKEPQVEVLSLAFSGDGRHIVSGSQNGTVQRWDTAPFRANGEALEGHSGAVNAVAYSPDGKTLASTGKDGALRLWDATSGQPIGRPLADRRAASNVSFSDDGSRVVWQGEDGEARWLPAPVTWQHELCAKLTRNMSRAQWQRWISSEIDYREQCPGLPVPP